MVSKTQLALLRDTFAAMPKKEKSAFTPREVVHNLAQDIQRMVEKDGYSFSDIADLLKRSGINLRPSTIRSYLHDYNAQNGNAHSKKRRASLATKPTKAVANNHAPAADTHSGHMQSISNPLGAAATDNTRPSEEMGQRTAPTQRSGA
jgi:hypothetical protein